MSVTGAAGIMVGEGLLYNPAIFTTPSSPSPDVTDFKTDKMLNTTASSSRSNSTNDSSSSNSVGGGGGGGSSISTIISDSSSSSVSSSDLHCSDLGHIASEYLDLWCYLCALITHIKFHLLYKLS